VECVLSGREGQPIECSTRALAVPLAAGRAASRCAIVGSHRFARRPVAESLRFIVNGMPVTVEGVRPQTTLLAWLRESQGLTGTKEGCAEGDCGACTVVLAEPVEGVDPPRLTWKPVNACVRLLPTIAGMAVFTVEALKSGVTLHPVQQAMVDCHGSQCGFCTPGFVMSLFGLYKNACRPPRERVDDALSGNLCRCTGYRPILAAAERMYELAAPTGLYGPGLADDGSRRISADESKLAEALAVIAPRDDFAYEAAGQSFTAPGNEAALARALAAKPDAQVVAGATDVGLWVTKGLRDLGAIVHTGRARELACIEQRDDVLEIGAAVSLADAFAALEADYPELAEVWQRFASVPIRHSGTLGGNVANGSPIGDSMPVLIALGASVVLRRGDQTRALPLEDFYLAYRKTALAPGEFVSRIRLPARPPGLLLRAYKISRRYDQDISAVLACFALRIRGSTVVDARIGCGGVATVPARARRTEGVLAGSSWNEPTALRAARALQDEFKPIDDMRASAAYRSAVLGNLVRRLWAETSGSAPITRIDDARIAPLPT